MREHKQQDVALWVDQTIAAHGAWDVVVFLLSIGRLSQEDYERWRLGEVSTLEEVFAGSPKRIVALLELAFQHVKQRGFKNSRQLWLGWGEHVEQRLRIFADNALQAQFSCRYAPAEDRPQLDLFMDTQRVVCFNRIRAALIQRSPQLPSLFDDAFENYADDPALARLEALYVVAKGEHLADLQLRFSALKQDITPIAMDELGVLSPQASDFLAPLWRNIAKDMKSLPFDPEKAQFHASAAWLQAKAYTKAEQAVKSVADWFEHTELHLTMIDIYQAKQDALQLRIAWLQFCLYCPKHAAAYLNSKTYEQSLQACGMRHLWQRFITLEYRETLACFPAWVLIQQPEYVASLRGMLIPYSEYGQQLHWIKTLLSEKEDFPSHVKLRGKLKASNPWLFGMLLAALKSPG